MNVAVGLPISGVLLLLKAEIYRHNDWRDVAPVIRSEVQRLEVPEMKVLLRQFCANGIRYVEKIGVKCLTADLGAAFSDIVDNQFYPRGHLWTLSQRQQ